jgi:hypothetical protein
MPETWRKVEVPGRLRELEKPFLAEVDALLAKWSGGDEEAYWYLSWRLELAAIGRNLVDQTKVRRQLFDEQKGLCPECGQELGSAKGHDVHKRERMFVKHQGYVTGNVVLLHRACHEQVHQREPHEADSDPAT